MNLEHLGWSPALADSFQPFADSGLLPGRVDGRAPRRPRPPHRERRDLGRRARPAAPPGRLGRRAAGRRRLGRVRRHPRAERATVQAVLPRRTAFSRKAAGLEAVEQVVAANVDVVFVVASLDDDFNPRRLERYLTLAWESGAEPVVVLTKVDLCDDVEAAVARARRRRDRRAGACRLGASPATGVDELAPHLAGGRTGGAGRLLGRRQVDARQPPARAASGWRPASFAPTAAAGTRPPTASSSCSPRRRLPDRHARDARARLWEAEEGLEQAFADVEELAARVPLLATARTSAEPGCAVRAAIADGTLDAGRLESCRKLQRELR